MSNEIATYSMILSKLSLGKSGTECPTKTQILAINSLIVIENASTYGANECVKIDDIRKVEETWNYYLTVSPTSMSFAAAAGAMPLTISSYKRKTINGVEQSGDTAVSLKSIVASGSGFSVSGTTVYASANEDTTNRTGTVTITQNESNKTVTISLLQYGKEVPDVYEYVFSVNPYKVSVDASGGSGQITIRSYETLNGSWHRDVDYSIDNSTLPSWASFNKSTSTFTMQSTTSTTGRTANVYFDQDESGKRDYAELTQTGYTPPADNYVFTWDDGSTSSKSESFQATDAVSAAITLVSTKNGSNHPWSVSSKPSWITTSTTSSKVTISASDNSGSARSGTIVLTQSGSGNTLEINVSQAAKPAEDEYYLGVRKSGETSSYESITFNNVPAKTTNWSGDYTYVSRKNGVFFDNVSFSANVSWITVDSNGGYTVAHNTSGLPRSGTITLTQGESGLKCYIYINQQEYSPTYGIGVNPSKIDISYAAQQVNFSINSYKTVLHSDGSVTEESVDYIFSSDTDWFAPLGTSTTNVTSIAVNRNTSSSERTGTFVLSNQKSSVTVTVTQAGRGGGN